MATCNKCGKTNYEGVKYCTACGTPLSTSSSTYSEESEEIKSPETGKQNSAKTFSEKTEKPKGGGLDPKIIYILVGILLIIGLIFFFKSCFSSKGEIKVKIDVKPDKHVFTDQPVTFIDNTPNAKSWEWSFGDNSDISEIDQQVTHTFEQEGTFWVKLTVNGKYTDSVQIIVTRQVLAIDSLGDGKVIISGPTTAKMGESVTYTDNTPDATEWTWMMMETGEIDSREKSITYTFKTPGMKTIRVKNNKARNMGTLKIKVSPSPSVASKRPAKSGDEEKKDPEKDECKMTTKIIPSMKSDLQKIIKYPENDNLPYEFANKYLCGDQTISVILNGELRMYDKFISDITNFHPLKSINAVNIILDPSNGHITQMVVTGNKK